MKEKTINIELTEDEFYAFQQFKKSVDRAAVVFKINGCNFDKEHIAILSTNDAFEKIQKMVEKNEEQNNQYLSRLHAEADERSKEIKHLKEQLDFMKRQSNKCATLEVKEEKKKHWFQFTIG